MKATRRALALLVVILALAGGAGAWLCAQPQGAQFIARAVNALSGGRIAIQGLRGSLAGPLSITRLVVHGTNSTLALHDMRLDWQPGALWHRQLHVRSLDISRMHLQTLRPSSASPQPPTTLLLPLALRVDRITVGEIVLGPPASPTVLRSLVARLESNGAHYRLQLQHLATPWADVLGDASLGATSPFALAAHVTLVRLAPQRLIMDAALSGSLLAPQLKAHATGAGFDLDLSGVFRPFAALPVASLDLHSHAIDLRALAAHAPVTRLDISATLGSSGPRTLAGNINLRNDLAGPLNRGRLPLVSAVAAVKIQPALAEATILRADLGGAGKAAGNGRWERGAYALRLDIPALDLAGIDSRFFPTRYATALILNGDAHQQHLHLSARQGNDVLRARLKRQADRIELTKLTARARGASLDASGRLTLAATRRFAVDARLANFDPAAFGRFPRGRLGAHLAATGSLAPHLTMDARLNLAAGKLAGRPVGGDAQLSVDWPRLPAVRANLDLAGNSLVLAGAWGGPHDRLNWNLDAPRLDGLGFGLAGRLRSTGQIEGIWPQPMATFKVDGSGLRLPYGLSAATLHLNVRLARGMNGPLQMRAEGLGLQYRRMDIARLRLALAGTLAHHRLSAKAQLQETNLDLAAEGGYANNVWSGDITAFDAQGKPPYNARLLAPAKLLLGPREQRLENLRMAVAGGEADIALLQRSPAGFASRGRLLRLPVAPLLALAPRPLPYTSNLVVQGSWNLNYAGTWQGEFRLARSQGDIAWRKPRLDLALSTLELSLTGSGDRLQGMLKADSRTLGSLSIDGWMSQTRGALWPPPASTVVNLHARGNLPTLAMLSPALPPGAQLNAQTDFDLRASGTLAAPDLSGHFAARGIAANFPDIGLRVKDGMLDLALAQNRIQVKEGWLAGEQGRVLVSGGGDWQAGGALVNFDFVDFALLSRPDVQATVNGTTRLELQSGRVTVAGKLKVIRARVATIDAGRPRLSDDVVVQGRPRRPAKQAPDIPVNLDLSLDLGDDFLVKAYGLDAQLQGQLKLKGSGLPTATGNVLVKQGTYTAYGQRLNITRGRLSFFGPLDNPALDILAVRQTGQVTAGVTLAGTAQRPLVALYSNPAMPDSETLSWLLFGHGLGSVNNEQFSLLQTAAAALLSRSGGASLQSTLAEKLGLSSIDIQGGSGGTLAGTVVSLGKQFSRSFRVRYEQSLDGLSQIVRAYYTLSPTLSLQAQTGSQSGLDVLFSRDFE